MFYLRLSIGLFSSNKYCKKFSARFKSGNSSKFYMKNIFMKPLRKFSRLQKKD